MPATAFLSNATFSPGWLFGAASPPRQPCSSGSNVSDDKTKTRRILREFPKRIAFPVQNSKAASSPARTNAYNERGSVGSHVKGSRAHTLSQSAEERLQSRMRHQACDTIPHPAVQACFGARLLHPGVSHRPPMRWSFSASPLRKSQVSHRRGCGGKGSSQTRGHRRRRA